MNDAFQSLIDQHHARMATLRTAFERDGYLYAVSATQPSYAILLAWISQT
jgi:hypothetical protein